MHFLPRSGFAKPQYDGRLRRTIGRKNTFDEASAVLGQDLWAMINGMDADLIGQTVNTQPIMLAAGVAVYRAYLEAGGKTPAVVAGHSLGEYTALVAAGALILRMQSNSSACAPN